MQTASEGRAGTPRSGGWLWALIDYIATVDIATLAIALGVLIGIFVRASYVFAMDFPLNDGGLFYLMTQELQANSYRLPQFTAYNAGDIPFAYAPLGFYLAGLLDHLTPPSLIDVFRFLPLTVTCLTLIAFVMLAQDLLKSRITVAVAVFAFALVPRSFIWLLMGGGVTRSLGLLFAMLALHQIYRMYTRESWRHVAAASILSALTVLSHLQTGSFLAFSAVVFLVAFGLHVRGLVRAAIVGTATLVLTAPWWGTVLSVHGLDPFLHANATGGTIFSSAELRAFLLQSLLKLGTTSEPLFPLIATLAFIGMIASVVTHRFLLPAWWAAIILLDARAFATFSTLPVAMLAGVGLTEVLLPVVLRPLPWIGRSVKIAPPGPDAVVADDTFFGYSAADAMRSWAPVLLGAFLWYAADGALLRSGETSSLVALSADERAGLEWVRANTPSDSKFLIISGESWQTDKTAEWFPVLAERVSVATVQGYEWVENDYFLHRVWVHDYAWGCAFDDAECIARLRTQTVTAFDYLLVTKPPYGQCCERLISTLRDEGLYRIEYDAAGATIFKRGTPPRPVTSVP